MKAIMIFSHALLLVGCSNSRIGKDCKYELSYSSGYFEKIFRYQMSGNWNTDEIELSELNLSDLTVAKRKYINLPGIRNSVQGLCEEYERSPIDVRVTCQESLFVSPGIGSRFTVYGFGYALNCDDEKLNSNAHKLEPWYREITAAFEILSSVVVVDK